MNLEQLKAILWLRWRLTRNQFYKSGAIGSVLSIITLVVLGSMSLSLAAGGLIGGLAAGGKAGPEVLMIICDAGFGCFLFFWLLSLITEIQRAESMELGKLLHLPISPRQVYLFNYAASHASPGIIMFVPLVICFCLGLTITGGVTMILLLPLCLAFLLSITSWTYCLRGWLAALMSNKRRARAVAVWTTIALVLIAQVPNLILQNSNLRQRERRMKQQAHKSQTPQTRPNRIPDEVVTAHFYVPPGWPGFAAKTLKEGQYWPALTLTALAALIAAAGILRGDQMTMRIHQGGRSGSTASASSPGEQASVGAALAIAPKPSMLSWQIPFVRDDTAGLALATFKSLIRAPEVKMAMLMPMIMFVAMFAFAGRLKLPKVPMALPIVITGGLVFAGFAVAPTMCNAFGLDRGGFRTLLLSPVRRQDMLVAKNLAFSPFYLFLSILVLIGAQVLLNAGIDAIITGLMQAGAGYLLFSLMANVISILTPYHCSMNSLQAKKFKPSMILAGLGFMMGTSLVGSILALPVLAQIGWQHFGPGFYFPLNLIVGLAVLTLSAVLYVALLRPTGALLHKRELIILREITSESE